MTTHLSEPSTAGPRAAGALRRLGLVASFGLIAALALTPARAPAANEPAGSVASEQKEGAALMRAVDSGKRDCGALSETDFERIGEYVMGRMIGSTPAHESMNELMARMMGVRAEEQMHVFMGRRFSGCGGGAIPPGFAGMMGMMMGGFRGPGAGPGASGGGFGPGGMMGGANGGYFGPGSMMGGYGQRASGPNADDGGPSAGAMIGMMAILIAAVGLALVLLRPRVRQPDPLEILRKRFANGELSAEEYKQRMSLLEGGKT